MSVHEIEQLKKSLDRVQMFDVKGGFFRAQRASALSSAAI
jgi:hypothetical protein